MTAVMARRIREAMKESHNDNGPMGGEGKTVEAGETQKAMQWSTPTRSTTSLRSSSAV